MSEFAPSIQKLIESFEKLPSIGHKTAARLAFHVLDWNEEETNKFVSSIVDGMDGVTCSILSLLILHGILTINSEP